MSRLFPHYKIQPAAPTPVDALWMEHMLVWLQQWSFTVHQAEHLMVILRSQTRAAPQEPRCLTCGHLHFYETDEGGFDSSDTVPWGKCKTCACKTPNYNKNYEASAAPQEPTP